MSVALSQRNDDDDPSGNGNPWGVNACPHIAKRRKDMFGDCALIEIIHLHDCLRGALQALQQDVGALRSAMLQKKSSRLDLSSLECKANGRFKVIWSVFRAHSSAEDEFIWPALRNKTQGRVKGSPKYLPNQPPETDTVSSPPTAGDSNTTTSPPNSPAAPTTSQEQEDDAVVDQESYEEDHASEERMFEVVDKLLTQLRDRLHTSDTASSAESSAQTKGVHVSLEDLMNSVHDLTCSLSEHLMIHLDREEMQCLPLVVKHLSKSEITDLVGQIMGKRSSDIMSGIMTMAVQSLEQDERHEMVRYMKQAMAGTFFDKWLSMSGWMDDPDELVRKREAPAPDSEAPTNKRVKVEKSVPTTTGTDTKEPTGSSAPPDVSKFSMGEITSQTELERLIRAIVTNPTLTPQQKNTTIQGLRDSVWKTNQRIKDLSGSGDSATEPISNNTPTELAPAVTKSGIPPTAHFAKAPDGTVETPSEDMPKFSSREMSPTYHDGTGGAVLGCPHYARSCKLRHPLSGRLYTCRLCCEQDREMPDGDEPLDRYAVTEVLCMKCNALQPVGEKCINPKCSSHDKPFANYYCNICHLYDDRPRPIFHCPYCNTCRMGQGLGIDFRHCMRCNACVALSDSEHRCIPQKLQGTCPICSESLFQSTEPLRGLKCGHVMHLSCFTEYRRTQRYTCPLCMKSVEDMSEYFALLDEAVRLQPMPPGFSSTFCTIYCQDCEATGNCSYHFVGLKCQHCGSYNTRELSRTHRLNTL